MVNSSLGIILSKIGVKAAYQSPLINLAKTIVSQKFLLKKKCHHHYVELSPCVNLLCQTPPQHYLNISSISNPIKTFFFNLNFNSAFLKAAKPKTPYTGGLAQHTKMKNPLKANDKVLVLTAIDVEVYQPNSERFFPYTA